MISQITSAPPVPLTPEDQAICSGAWIRPYSGVPCAATDANMVRAGQIYMMRKGDRHDYAKMLALGDEVYSDVQQKHFARAFM
jgi:hypothetical protein